MQPGISPLQVIGIAGSLRTRSFNRGLLRAAQEVAPAGMQITIMDVTPIPFYNADVEAKGDPAPVAHLEVGRPAGRCAPHRRSGVQQREVWSPEEHD